jgi:hypothetical protein
MKRAVLVLGVMTVLLAGCQRQQQAQAPVEKPPAQPTVYTAADLLTAFKAAYGQPVPVQATDQNGDTVVYNPAALIDITPEIAALIVKGEIPDGCHACTGADSIFYMRHEGKAFELLGKWPDIAGAAGYGQAADWTTRSDLTKYPALLFTSSDGGQGCSTTGSDILELTPSRPILRAQNVVTQLDYQPHEDETDSKHLKGVMSAQGPNHALRVTYTGSETFTLDYDPQGDTWTPNPTGHAAPSC